MRHLLLLLSPVETPWLAQSFCTQDVSENFGQTHQALEAREKEEARTWPKVFALAVSTHCLTELHMREKLCFVIFLPTRLYAVNIFFLSGCFSFTGEHQLWSVDRINPKNWEIHGGSVYSCMLHIWNSWLCNSGKLYVAAKKQSCSSFFCWYEPLSISYLVKIKSTLKGKTGKITVLVIAWSNDQVLFFLPPPPPSMLLCAWNATPTEATLVIKDWFTSDSGIPLECTLSLRLQSVHTP